SGGTKSGGATAAVCGNGIIEAGEQSDDGKPPADGDGCSKTCQKESGWACSPRAPSTRTKNTPPAKTYCNKYAFVSQRDPDHPNQKTDKTNIFIADDCSSGAAPQMLTDNTGGSYSGLSFKPDGTALADYLNIFLFISALEVFDL